MEDEIDTGHQTVAIVSTPGVALGEVVVRAGARAREHAHDVPHLVLVLAGGMTETVGRGTVEMQAGALRVTGSASHDLRIGPDGLRCMVMELEGWTEWERDPAPVETHFCTDPGLAQAVLGLRRYYQDADPLSLLLELDAVEVFARFARWRGRRDPVPPRWLARVRELLADGTTALDVAALAAEAGVHPNHLVRAFRQHYGTSTTAFVRRRRAERATRALRFSGSSLAAVAVESGYFDQSHMTRELRRLLGCTPARLRAGERS
jgi:AraC family transcriptional regulator